MQIILLETGAKNLRPDVLIPPYLYTNKNISKCYFDSLQIKRMHGNLLSKIVLLRKTVLTSFFNLKPHTHISVSKTIGPIEYIQ